MQYSRWLPVDQESHIHPACMYILSVLKALEMEQFCWPKSNFCHCLSENLAFNCCFVTLPKGLPWKCEHCVLLYKINLMSVLFNLLYVWIFQKMSTGQRHSASWRNKTWNQKERYGYWGSCVCIINNVLGFSHFFPFQLLKKPVFAFS